MPNNTFTLDALLPATPEYLIEFLMQPENYVGLQPFMVASRTLERGTDQQGRAFVHYAAIERVPLFGILRMNTPLDVVTTVTQPGTQLISIVNSSMSVCVEFDYDFQPAANATRLRLTVTARTPRLLTGLVLARAKQAQTLLLKNLKRRLESSVSG